VKEFGVVALQHSVADLISTTDMSRFTVILGLFCAHKICAIAIPAALFPFSAHSHYNPIWLFHGIPTGMGFPWDFPLPAQL